MAVLHINKKVRTLSSFKVSPPYQSSVCSHPKTPATSISIPVSISGQSDSEPTSHPARCLDSSYGLPSFFRRRCSLSSSSNSKHFFPVGFSSISVRLHSEKRIAYRGSSSDLCLSIVTHRNHVRWLSGSSSNKVLAADDKSMSGGRKRRSLRRDSVMMSKIIELIRKDEGNLLQELGSMDVTLSLDLINEIFRVLNCEKLSSLQFFEWIRHRFPQYRRKTDICSLAVDNCGWLGDFESMLNLMKCFNSEHITLSRNAFGFVTVSVSSEPETRSYVEKLIELLDKAGGTCRGSGVIALIEMFSLLGLYDMCKFVMEKTEKRVSYYGIIVREMCRRRNFDEAMDMLNEMKQVGCDPNSSMYNYVFSHLCRGSKIDEACKVLVEMIERGLQPDGITYEILIFSCCKQGNLDNALEFYDQMVSRGIIPRLTTHEALIKEYFYQKKYEEAYRYAVDNSDEYICSSNRIYGFLIDLHRESGNLIVAHEIFSEMISKGLRPDFVVHTELRKSLQKLGREDLAKDIGIKLSSLSLCSNMGSSSSVL